MDEKQRITVQVSSTLNNRLKNTVYWTPGLTIASCIESALENELNKLEQNNNGEFAQRPGELKAGRPIK